jgi:hypothetical protein
MKNQTILDQVVAGLESRVGELRDVAEKCDLPYDTVLRIKNRENDPSFSRVQRLHDFLFKKKARPAKQEA